MKAHFLFRNGLRTFIQLAFIFAFTICFTKTNAQVYTQAFSSGIPASGWVNTDLTVPWGNATLFGIENIWFSDDQESGLTSGTCGAGLAFDPSLYMGSTLGGGSSYLADVVTNRRIESPNISTIGFTTLVLSFDFIGEGEGTTDKAYLQYSINGGAIWIDAIGAPTSAVPALPGIASLNNLKSTNGPCAPQGQWTHITWNMPVACENIANLKIAIVWQSDDNSIGSDPAFAIDDINISGVGGGSNSITTGISFSGSYCACDTINMPFTSTGTYLASNVYDLEMSDAAGSFAAPTIIGTLASTANSGIVNSTIPCATPVGLGYRFRVVSSSPVVTGNDNGANVAITGSIAASITISASPGVAVCSGVNITFTANNVNSIPLPQYQWYLNGGPIVGATSSTYSSSGLANGNNITCTISSLSGCVTGSPATSNTLTITITGTGVMAAATITASENPICTGTPVTFTVVNTNGIPSPSYQWQNNSVNIGGATGTTYTSAGLANGNIITCVITSLDPCVLGSPATSNSIIMTVGNSFVPSVTFAISPNDTICAGDVVTITATPVFGGSAPFYAWTLNAASVNANIPTYSSGTFNDGDVITCTMTSSLTCANPTSATAAFTITVDPGGVVDVTIVAAPADTACPGQNVTFTATGVNGYTNPVYQWFLNGTPVGTNATIYLNSSLANGDVITCQLTSSSACATNNPAMSAPITMVITNTLNVSVIATSALDSICAGDSATFWAAATNGGGTPIYQWQVNGFNVGDNADFYTYIPQIGDQIICIVISSDPCAFSGFPVASNIVVPNVVECPVPVTLFEASKYLICQGDCIDFFDLSENEPVGWHWFFEGANPPDTYDQNPVSICYPNSGTFSVRLIANNHAGAHDTTFVGLITVDDPISIKAGEDAEIQVGMTHQLLAIGGFEYTWSPVESLNCSDCPDPIASPIISTYYIVTDTLGCASSDTVFIKVFDDFEIYIPNAFSPNGDGQNDVLYVRGNGIKEMYFVVFDRLGEKVFSTGNKDEGWDGLFRGRELNTGVFSYYVRATMTDGSSKSSKGNVTLFK